MAFSSGHALSDSTWSLFRRAILMVKDQEIIPNKEILKKLEIFI